MFHLPLNNHRRLIIIDFGATPTADLCLCIYIHLSKSEVKIKINDNLKIMLNRDHFEINSVSEIILGKNIILLKYV